MNPRKATNASTKVKPLHTKESPKLFLLNGTLLEEHTQFRDSIIKLKEAVSVSGNRIIKITMVSTKHDVFFI